MIRATNEIVPAPGSDPWNSRVICAGCSGPDDAIIGMRSVTLAMICVSSEGRRTHVPVNRSLASIAQGELVPGKPADVVGGAVCGARLKRSERDAVIRNPILARLPRPALQGQATLRISRERLHTQGSAIAGQIKSPTGDDCFSDFVDESLGERDTIDVDKVVSSKALTGDVGAGRDGGR